MPSRPVRSKPTLLKKDFQRTATGMEQEGEATSYCQQSRTSPADGGVGEAAGHSHQSGDTDQEAEGGVRNSLVAGAGAGTGRLTCMRQ